MTTPQFQPARHHLVPEGTPVRRAVIVDAIRTPTGRGKPGGALNGRHPVDLLAGVLSTLVERTGVDPALIGDVIAGCVTQAGEQSLNIARSAVLSAGLPESVPAQTIDRQCGSGQQAVTAAAHGIIAGGYDIAIACGVESMSRAPMFSNVGPAEPAGRGLAARYPDGLVRQGISAELVAARWKIDRSELDGFAARSHALAAEASQQGRFSGEIVPTAGSDDGTAAPITADETIRRTDTATLAGLAPVFRDDEIGRRFPEIGWRVTAGNSSPLSDGAAAALLVEESVAGQMGLTPRARYVDGVALGSDPLLMLMAIAPATERLLQRQKLGIDDIDAYEVNEAFASVPLAWQRELAVDPERVNQHGGAIALGHPLGASGVRILATLLGVLERIKGRYGLQAMCEAGGLANATLIERL